MANNPFYFMGKRDAMAMRAATWGADWTSAQKAAYEAGYDHG